MGWVPVLEYLRGRHDDRSRSSQRFTTWTSLIGEIGEKEKIATPFHWITIRTRMLCVAPRSTISRGLTVSLLGQCDRGTPLKYLRLLQLPFQIVSLSLSLSLSLLYLFVNTLSRLSFNVYALANRIPISSLYSTFYSNLATYSLPRQFRLINEEKNNEEISERQGRNWNERVPRSAGSEIDRYSRHGSIPTWTPHRTEPGCCEGATKWLLLCGWWLRDSRWITRDWASEARLRFAAARESTAPRPILSLIPEIRRNTYN